MKFENFKKGDKIKIVICDCCEGEAVVVASSKHKVVAEWLYYTMCYPNSHLDDDKIIIITQEDFERDLICELRVIE